MHRLIELRFVVEPSASGDYSIVATLLEETPTPPDFEPVAGSRVQKKSETRTLSRALGKLPAPPWRGTAAMLGPAIQQLVDAFFQSERSSQRSDNHRFVVQSLEPMVLESPWEELLTAGMPSSAFPPRVAFVARYPRDPLRPCPMRLPLTLAIDGGMAKALQVFDPYTRQAVSSGAFEVRDARSTEPDAELVHLVNPSRARRPEVFELLGPRLVTLEWNGEDPSWEPDPSLVTELLRRGASAVLLVSGDRGECEQFFQTFYHKLLHTHPLEQCALEALKEVRRRKTPRIRVLLGVARDGEYGLLFTRVAAELRARADPGTRKPSPLESGLHPFSAPARVDESRIARTLTPHLERLREATETTARQAYANLSSASAGLFNPGSDRMYSVSLVDEVKGLVTAVGAFRELAWASDGGTTLRRQEGRDNQEVQRELTRLLTLWLSLPGDEPPIDTAHPLRVGQGLSLHVRIATAALAQAFSAAFPDDVLQKAFKYESSVSLDVCVFHDGGTARVPQPRGTMKLPRFGPSTEFTTSVQFEKPGQCRLRVCVYHRNTLLQSVVVEAEVVAAEEPLQPPAAGAGPAIRYALDYVASPDLLLLDEHAAPALSLVTNRTQDGSLWLGVFSDGSSGHGGLRAGTLHSFAPDTLAQQTEQVRDALQQVQGTARYRYDGPLDASNRDERARQLAQLAVQGWRLYDTLFNSNPSLSDKDKDSFDEGLEAPGTISIARCSLVETSIPWAALYDRPLDIGGGTAPTVCPVFLDQLAAGQDLLDEPAKCHELATCPLKGEAARNTVCPFGFWGIRHQLEQPLKQLSVENEQQVAEELTSPAFVESCRVPASEGKPPALMGYGTNIPTGSEHLQELQQLSGWKLEASAERAKVVAALEQGPANLLYIFCHGVIQGGVFKLQIPPQFIEAADLNRQKGRQPFLVFLNACESMATLPEVTNALLGKLMRLGALAVIGSEIKINNLFARPFATRVLDDFLQGRSLGEAFLGARRHFLRSLNPLGLAYTLNAPVNVHLHGATCRRCPQPT